MEIDRLAIDDTISVARVRWRRGNSRAATMNYLIFAPLRWRRNRKLFHGSRRLFPFLLIVLPTTLVATQLCSHGTTVLSIESETSIEYRVFFGTRNGYVKRNAEMEYSSYEEI